jgi:hypothetical protein
MSIDLNFDNKVLYNKLKEHFNNNMKFSYRSYNYIFIVTKDDLFYRIFARDENISSFILNNDESILESMIVEELCHKKINDLDCGEDISLFSQI